MHDRRRHDRKPSRLLVQHQVSTDEGPQVDYATDISIGGLFIASRKDVARDATLHVQFAPAKDSRLVSAFARVTHVTPQGFGAQFISIDPDAVQLIQASA